MHLQVLGIFAIRRNYVGIVSGVYLLNTGIDNSYYK